MPVIKHKTNGKYVNVSKCILENHELSLRDRGLLITLLSLPDTWNFSVAGLSKILPDGKSAIAAGIKQLTEMGYLARDQERTSQGKYGMSKITVEEVPCLPFTDKPLTENRVTDKPVAVKSVATNQTQVITKEVNNNQVIINESNSLPSHDYNELVAKYGKDVVDYQIDKIKTKKYKGCMNMKTIALWCDEYNQKVKPPKTKNQFNNFEQREYDFEELERMLLAK